VEVLGMTADLRKACRKMTVEIPKKLAIQLFAYAREAERSVDFSYMGPDQWVLLQDYYGPGKQAALREIVDQLKPLIPSYPPLLARDQFFKGTLTWILRRPFIRLANLSKLKWRFSRNEIIFINQAFKCLLDIVPLRPVPPALTLVNMRLDLFTCECIIQRRLDGIPEIEKANRVEHFCQPDHIEHVKIEDLLEYEKTSGESIDVKAPTASGGITTNPTNRVARHGADRRHA
jgi:hypothetical protein